MNFHVLPMIMGHSHRHFSLTKGPAAQQHSVIAQDAAVRKPSGTDTTDFSKEITDAAEAAMKVLAEETTVRPTIELSKAPLPNDRRRVPFLSSRRRRKSKDPEPPDGSKPPPGSGFDVSA